MEFPHLEDTSFPNIDNVNTYAHQVVFDYTRWVPSTKIYLCNVRWNGDYEDCVKFDSDKARDDWFDELIEETKTSNPDCATVLKIATNVVQSQVKVPIPYDRATQFNYLVVDVPVMTSDDDMLPYETKDGYRRWHFFVENFDATAPSTTRLNIKLDYWTQYINSVGFNYFVLERGHAPVAATDVDKYLENPIENNDYLLTPDVNFGTNTVSQHTEFIPFGNGEKYICFASTCTASQLTALGTVTTDSSATFGDPTFSDEPNYPDSSSRWGRQYHVEGYGFGSGRDYSNVTTPTGNAISTGGRIPNNLTVYAIKATSASDFMNSVLSKSPSFMRTIQACFMVAKELIELGTAHTIAGYTVYECEGTESKMRDLKLTKEMFDIPERYQKFAKLYTFPYSELEITDNEGKSVTVRIEETGSISAHAITSVAYPYLKMRMFLTGIGGKGSNTYQWQDLRGSHDAEISGSDWFKFCFDMDIPTYALYMDGLTSWELTNYNRSLSNARKSALVNYHNSVREANNAKNNSVDNAETNNTNSRAAALTQRNNTVNASNTQHTNTNNDANTTDANNANLRACNSDVTANNNACSTANTNEGIQKAGTQLVNENGRMSALTSHNSALNTTTTEKDNEVTTATSQNNFMSTVSQAMGQVGDGVVTGMLSGAAAGTVFVPGLGTMGGATGGAVIGAMAGAAGAIATYTGGSYVNSNAQTIVQANTSVTELTNATNRSNDSTNASYNQDNYSNDSRHTTNINTNNVNTATSNTNRNNQMNKSNTDNTTGTMRTNATNLDNMMTTNANNLRDMSYANSERLRATTESNADWTNRTAIAAAQDTLRNTQNNARATLYDMRNSTPVMVCNSKGDMDADYMRTKGVQFKIRTQSKDSIRCAGDEFTRYGYALNHVWEVGELRLMKHFTYWKAKDCWVYDRCETSDLAQSVIGLIFKNGVTVWSDPKEIGRVNPYDN